MSQRSTTHLRRNLDQLEQREAPADVTAAVDFRPLDFTITGTVQTTDVHPNTIADGQAKDTFSGNVTLTGRMNYDANGGVSGTIQYQANGNGNSVFEVPSRSGANGTDTVTVNYSGVETGTLTMKDANGVWTTTGTFSRVSDRTQSSGSDHVVLGPSGVKLNFDPSSMTVTGGWASQSGANSTTGAIVGNVTQPKNGETDLSVSGVSLVQGAEGYDAQFKVGVTGKLMTPPDKASPGAIAEVFWTDGVGRTEAANVTVDVPWNAGAVNANVTGLVAPDWATALKIAVTANGWTETATQVNNTGAADLGSAVDPNAPPPPPPPASKSLTAVSGVDSPSLVNVYAADGTLKYRLAPYGTNWTGGISTATGDVTGDGVMDIITGAGNGGGPHVKIYDGQTGNQIASFFAYDSNFRGGVNVAAGDINGDSLAEVITGSGVGGGPHVKVFDGRTQAELKSFYALDPAGFRYGVNVAAADFDADGKAEIVAGAATGSSPLVRVFRAKDLSLISSFLAYDSSYKTGARVRTEKLDDGRTVIVTYADPMFSLPVRAFDVNGNPVV